MYDAFLWIGISGTIFIIITILLSLIGMGDFDSDFDADMGTLSGLLPSFSFRNFITFLTMFGWVGALLIDKGLTIHLSVVLSTVCGLAFTILMNSLFLFISKLSHSNVMSLDKAIGKEATVYSRITDKNPGQVTIILNNSVQTIGARSSGKIFNTGDRVKVIAISGTGLIVDSI